MEILEKVKASLGITGDYQNATLSEYIAEVKEYMRASGVPAKIVESEKAAGTIARGVSDLWNYGDGKLSEYFMQRVTQMAYTEAENG